VIGLQQPDSGYVRIHGEEIAALKPDQLNEVRKKMGFLFQQGALYASLSVEENVAFPLNRHTKLSGAERKQKTRELLENVGMDRERCDREFLFHSTYRLNADFSNVAGLANSAEARVGGIHEGTVRRIDLPRRPDQKVQVEMDMAKGRPRRGQEGLRGCYSIRRAGGRCVH
jgi:ABC-type branched-subunit amino acid transport system ATPase component